MNERSEGVGAGLRVGARRPGPAEAAAAAAANRLPESTAELAATVHADRAALEHELGEIEMLVQQARTEAARHESKRAAAADRIAALSNAADIAEQSRQLVTLTRRAVVMQTQVDVLDGKIKVLQRFLEATGRIADGLDNLAGTDTATPPGVRSTTGSRARAAGTDADDGGGETLPPALSRIVLSAQEDLRREIARTMHDGPAQSLTNIVLQAQIVERLLIREPESAVAEVRQLISMVQQTLDATKSFIFDVRPMVLDDLGLVPTIRRAARERGRRAQIPVDFESYGADRRLTMEMESGLFRILDETLAAYLAGRPDRVSIRLDWTDGLEARIAAHRPAATAFDPGAPSAAATAADAAARAEPARGRGRNRATAQSTPAPEVLPAALAAMIEDRRAADTAAKRAVGAIPAATRREVQQRAATLGIAMDMTQDGREVHLVVEAGTAAE